MAKAYPIFTSNHTGVYTFISTGSIGKVKKVVVFEKMDDHGELYNIAFGDLVLGRDQAEGLIDFETVDDMVLTGNNDVIKVLATVLGCVEEFLIEHPQATFLVTGSDPKRTRLYSALITRHWHEVQIGWEVFGLVGTNFANFVPWAVYEALVFRKKRLSRDYENSHPN